MNKRWYLGYVRARHEFEVAESLTWDGYDVWCGRINVRKRGQRGSRIEEIPALPKYLFLCLSDDDFHTIRHKYLAHSMVPLSRLGVKEFEEFKERILHMETIDKLEPGAVLEITDGPFQHERATLKKLVEDDRLSVEINAFGRVADVVIAVDQVRVE